MQYNLQTTLLTSLEKTCFPKPKGNYIIRNGRLIWVNPNVYLQSSGTQYIDTGFKPTANTEIEVAMTSATSGGTYPEISVGSRVGANDSAFVIYARAHGNNSGFALGNYTNIFYVQVDPTIKHIYKLSSPTTSCLVDGILASSSLPSFDGNSYAIYLFGMNNGGTSVQYQYRLGKIYYVKIWDNDTLVRHFVPVPEGLVIGNFTCPNNGMFDIVNQQFYGNSGTGDFTCGKNS